MKKKLIAFATLVAIMLVSMFAATASAATQTMSGKGAIATWHIPNTSNSDSFTDIYVVLSQSNSGKDGNLYVQVHGKPFEAIPVSFNWNNNHIEVSAAITMWGSTHDIVITWQALPKSQGVAPGSSNGMTVNLDGSWKAAIATVSFEADHPGGTVFDSMSAYIVHGDATITLP